MIGMLQTVMDALPMMIALFDDNLRPLWCNRPYAEAVGLEAQDSRDAPAAARFPSSAADTIRGALENALKGERTSILVDLAPPDTGSRIVKMDCRSIVCDGGEIACLMTGQDATEPDAVGERLSGQQELLAARRFVGGVSHDFNNHLGVIVGNLSLLRLGVVDATALRRLEACRDAVGHCAALTAQLQSYASGRS